MIRVGHGAKAGRRKGERGQGRCRWIKPLALATARSIRYAAATQLLGQNVGLKMKSAIPAQTVLAAAAMFCLTLSAASAQGTAQQRSACMGDAFRFCSAYIPNVTSIEACLRQNVNSLDPGCRAEFQPSGRTKLRARHFR